MYESQTKRLCVREASSDGTRAEHPSNSSGEATTESLNIQQHLQSNPSTSNSAAAQDLTRPKQQITHSNTTSNVVLSPKATKRARATSSPTGGVHTAASEPSGLRSCLDQSDTANMTASATENTTAGDENQSPNKIPATSNSSPVIHKQNNDNAKSISIDNQNLSENNNSTDNLTEQELIDRLASETIEQRRLDLILAIRNLITACNKKKNALLKNPNFKKTLDIIDVDNDSSSMVKAQFSLLLCSIAKGGEINVGILNNYYVDEKVYYHAISSQDDALIEASLRCLRVLMSWPSNSKPWILYEKRLPSTGNKKMNSQKIIDYAQSTKSYIAQECIAYIFAETCLLKSCQNFLLKSGALTCISQLIESTSNRVIASALNWLSSMCIRNPKISAEVIKVKCASGVSLLDRLIDLMSKDKCNELQFLSANCYTQIYRALGNELGDYEANIVSHVLPTLVRMVQQGKPAKLRAESAKCIAYLIENDTQLQETASICNHLIGSLANMLEQTETSMADLRDHDLYQRTTSSETRNLSNRDPVLIAISNRHRNQAPRDSITPNGNDYQNSTTEATSARDGLIEDGKEMKRAAFLALAALTSNLEPIRKKIFETCVVMDHLVKGLVDNDLQTLKSVLTCLLSLSRSVQQLRTSFAENSVYSALKSLLRLEEKQILILVLAVLCNISLDFSPGKQQFLDSSTISTLCSFTRSTDPEIQLHGMWILMNMVYQLKDQNLKFKIFKTLGPDHVMHILENSGHEDLVMKTLGFLRNLLSQKPHIDSLMSSHGKKIIQSLVCVLERSCSSRVKEQALCVLTNIAHGSGAKALILKNQAVIAHIARSICDEKAGDMRLAAICCITNLAHKEQDGSCERLDELRKFGIEEQLKSMLNTGDSILSDRVRTAYNQFSRGSEDKCVN